MSPHRIAVIPGDGIGKEVVPEGIRVLECAATRFGIALEWNWFDFSSCDYYSVHGQMLPDDWFETLSRYDAIYFGAVGWPATVHALLRRPGQVEQKVIDWEEGLNPEQAEDASKSHRQRSGSHRHKDRSDTTDQYRQRPKLRQAHAALQASHSCHQPKYALKQHAHPVQSTELPHLGLLNL